MPWKLFLLAILGLSFGSFFNVLIYRLPRRISIISPPSHCPNCRRPIRWFENIPILSYVVLRGRCAGCKNPISIRYPVVEFSSAVMFPTVDHIASQFGFSLIQQAFALVYFSILLVIIFVDLETLIIPDELSIGGIGVGILYALVSPDAQVLGWWKSLLFSMAGSGAGIVLFLLIALVSGLIFKREAMGGGDIKLVGMLGAFLGIKELFFVIFISVLLGGIVSIGIILAKAAARKYRVGTMIPFGPFLAIGGMIGFFWLSAIINWYLRLFGIETITTGLFSHLSHG